MSDIIVPQGLNELDATIFLVKLSDRASAMSRELLWRIQESKAWESRFSSWNEFVESSDGLGKSASWASKQITVHKHYVIDGKVSHAKLENIDNERLYLAIKLPMSPEEQVVRAETWGRSEIKAELASKGGADCSHDCEHVTICTRCHSRVQA